MCCCSWCPPSHPPPAHRRPSAITFTQPRISRLPLRSRPSYLAHSLPRMPSGASAQHLVKRHHLEPVFAPFQELAVSSLFNNMEINFGKENHDIPRGGGAVSYFTRALELGHFFWHDTEFIAVMLPTHWEIETNREEVSAR